MRMEDNIQVLVNTLTTTTTTINRAVSDNIHIMLTNLLQQVDFQYLCKFITENFQSLSTLEQWAWKMLSEDCNTWLNESKCIKLFHSLATFNKSLIFNADEIDSDKKVSLLFPETTDLITKIFEQVQQINDENHPYFNIISLWLNNLSYFIHEHTQYVISPIITNIDNTIVQNFIMNEQYKSYLQQLEQSNISQKIFTPRLLFYLKTCSLSMNSYCFCKNQNFPFTSDEILRQFTKEYLNIISLHSVNVQSWNKELLACITCITSLIYSCCCWDADKTKNIQILLPTEEITYEYVESLIRIINHKPFHEQIQIQRSNNVTILIETILNFLLAVVHTDNILSFIRFQTNLLEILLPLAETSRNNRISSFAYGLLGEILSDEHLKEVKITDNLCEYFFYLLEQVWNHPKHKSHQVLVPQLLRGLLSLAKNDAIQQKIAETNKVSLLIEMCDEYPIVYDILWALSFHHDIQQQLRSNQNLMLRLNHLKEELHHEPMGKITYGILWNLKSMYEYRETTENSDETMFDIMISYSHKDKIFCKKLYDELIKIGYRVWIDFDQIHGNVMDAMAQAIERSNTIIICMSEQYRRSNYCRAEASYAFQRRARIVPILLQEHYHPDGWLLFLVGQLLYIDFTKHEFSQSMEILVKELKSPIIRDDRVLRIESADDTSTMNLNISFTPRRSIFPVISDNIMEWTQTDVREWLTDHNLLQMCQLLSDYDGPSLMNFYKYLTDAESHQILKLLQEDSLRRTNQSLSIVELARFQNLIERQQKLADSKKNNKNSRRRKIKSTQSCFNNCKIL